MFGITFKNLRGKWRTFIDYGHQGLFLFILVILFNLFSRVRILSFINYLIYTYTQKFFSVKFTKVDRLKWLNFLLISPEKLFAYYGYKILVIYILVLSFQLMLQEIIVKVRRWQRYCLHNLAPFPFSLYMQASAFWPLKGSPHHATFSLTQWEGSVVGAAFLESKCRGLYICWYRFPVSYIVY